MKFLDEKGPAWSLDAGITSITLQQILFVSRVVCENVVNAGVVQSCGVEGGLGF